MRTQKGITLVALVVTIIVLIILAGTSISLLLGDNGILKMTQQSVADYTNAQEKENKVFAEFQEEYSTITIEDKEVWTNDGKLVSIATKEGYTIKYTTDGCSGIAEYRFKNNSGQCYEWTPDTTYTFREIYGDLAGVNCPIQAEVKNHAGNIIETAVSQTTKTTCLNPTYYTANARQPIVSIASTDSYADYTSTKENAGGAICGVTFYYYSSSRPVIAPLIVSPIKSAASIATSNYRELHNISSWVGSISYHGVTYYFSTSPILDKGIFSRYYNAKFPILRKLV